MPGRPTLVQDAKENAMEFIRRIIVPTDFSDLSQAALRTAAKLAREDDASIHLLNSIRFPLRRTGSGLNIPDAIWQTLRRATQEKMYESQLLLEELGVSEIELVVSDASHPAEAIVDLAAEIDADLVVMATHGRRGLKHAFVGSGTARTIRASPIPVLAVKGSGIEQWPLRRILVPTDFSLHAERALDLACFLAKRSDAQIDLIHVLDRSPDYYSLYGTSDAAALDSRVRAIAVERLEAIAQRLEKDGLSTTSNLETGSAKDLVCSEAARLGSDLIVMGTHGLSGFANAILGSVTERTLRFAPCSVLTTTAQE